MNLHMTLWAEIIVHLKGMKSAFLAAISGDERFKPVELIRH